MILEKGVWEDTFPLGEGYLHLKLQVVLSDEERDRIRMMVLVSLSFLNIANYRPWSLCVQTNFSFMIC